MAIRHVITLHTLSNGAKEQRKLRIAVFSGIALFFGLIACVYNPMEPSGLSKFEEFVGCIAMGCAVQAVSFVVFNVIDLVGDAKVRKKTFPVEPDSGESKKSYLASMDYIFSLLMMLGLVGVLWSPFEQGFYFLGILIVPANIAVWVYLRKTTKR